MKNNLIAQIAVDQTVYHIDKPYDYYLPENLNNENLAGCRVLVPFGGGNATRQGIITNVLSSKDAQEKELKSVICVLDETPILNVEMLKLAQFMKSTLFCTYFEAIRVLLPAGITMKLSVSYKLSDGEFKYSESETQIAEYLKRRANFTKREKILSDLCLPREATVLEKMYKKGYLLRDDTAKRKISDAKQKSVRYITDKVSKKLTPKQEYVLKYLREIGECSVKELCYFTGAGQSVINNLEKYGAVGFFDFEYYRTPVYEETEKKNIILTESQNNVYNGLSEKLGEYSANLLYGVTGSGKTQVFLKLADKVLRDGKSVMVLVPEIALTPQTISIFSKRYGDTVAVIHSGITSARRTDEWKRINDGKAKLVIGTRSAVFAPLHDIGLVIIDEEQEHTYKSEQSPKYHARDIALFRAKHHGAMLILASATPSVETFTSAINNKIGLWKLTSRYGDAKLPEVKTVDMREELYSGNTSPLSKELSEEITKVLENKNQAILLMNRRGYNTYISCTSCKEVATCPNCSISLTYHSANNRFMCHYCGYSLPNNSVCPSCGESRLRYSGVGTQKIEEELKTRFPSAKILRMDADTTFRRDAYEKNLTAFSDGEYDIMLGTQMVAKGLDFPNVTLVGVLNADKALHTADFRSFEKTFSLLTQVVGRSGRGKLPGKAIIQTSEPENTIIRLAKEQDYDGFYESEIMTRKLMIYPPYCNIAQIVVMSQWRDNAKNGIYQIFDYIKELIMGEYSDIKVNILGPSEAAVPRVNNKYRYRIIVKFRKSRRFYEFMSKVLLKYKEEKIARSTSLSVDIDPETII